MAVFRELRGVNVNFFLSSNPEKAHPCAVFGEFQAKNLASSSNELQRSFSGNETSNWDDWGGRVVTYLTFLPDCRRSGVRIPVGKNKFVCVYSPSLSYKCFVAVY